MMKAFTAGALVAAASATDLKLSWSDCGDASTKVKIASFTPSALTLGQKTTMTGTGNLGEDVAGATFDLEMTGAIGKLVSCKGDASAAKTCSLPLGTGSLTFDAMTFPLKAGSTNVNVDISLSSAVPASLQTTDTKCTASSSSGDKLFCIEIKSAPAVEYIAPKTDLKLSWSDCGDASTKVKIASFTPSTLTLGQKTTMTGTGNLGEDVAGATFDLEMTGAIGKLVSCKGDASAAKTCSLPLGTGSLTFDAMTFPLKAGSTDVNVDISLSSAVPASLQTTDTKCTASSSSGDKLFCIEIKSAPAVEYIAPKTDLKLSWSDCGDASTKVKIASFTPSTLTLGQKTTMTGTGNLGEEVAGATFDLEMTGAIGKLVSCKGDASAAKTCSLPLGTGSLTFDAMTFPLKAGSTNVNVDISLSSAVPASLQTTDTKCTASSSSGDKLFCIEIKSAPAAIVV